MDSPQWQADSSKPMGILGAGRSGLAAAHYLAARGFPLVVGDDNPAPTRLAAMNSLPNITMRLGPPDGHSPFSECQAVLLSPGIPRNHPFLAALPPEKVINDVEWLWRETMIQGKKPPPVFVGITGTNGKSTVTSLVGAMLAASGKIAPTGGNLEPPALDLWREDADAYVLELSSFQLESVDHFHTQVGVLLNLTPDHLDRYDGEAAYLAAKARLFRHQKTGDAAIVNADDPALTELATTLGSSGATVIPFSVEKAVVGGVYALDGHLWDHRTATPERLLPLSAMRIRGRPNHANAAAALAAALCAGGHKQGVVEALTTFPGLPHRMEWVRTLDDVDYYDDSKGTNVGAVMEALASFSKDVILIAGGRDKKGDFSPLTPQLRQRCAAAILIGEAAEKMEQTFAGATALVRAASMEEAVVTARNMARPGGAVLLSPACASFDMFRDYHHRGECFKEAVRDLH